MLKKLQINTISPVIGPVLLAIQVLMSKSNQTDEAIDWQQKKTWHDIEILFWRSTDKK